MSVSVASGVSYTYPSDEIRINLDGEGGDLVPGVTSFFYRSTQAGKIVGWAVVADAVGSLDLNIILANGTIPTDINYISIINPPKLTNEQIAISFDTTQWDQTIRVGDIIGVDIKNCSGITSAVVALKVERF